MARNDRATRNTFDNLVRDEYTARGIGDDAFAVYANRKLNPAVPFSGSAVGAARRAYGIAPSQQRKPRPKPVTREEFDALLARLEVVERRVEGLNNRLAPRFMAAA